MANQVFFNFKGKVENSCFLKMYETIQAEFLAL